MQKTTFKIAKMDCPSEEQMIRMKLADLAMIESLDFNIPDRQLTVYHTLSYEPIFQRLDSLKFDTSVIDSIMVDSYQKAVEELGQERRLLWQVLAINMLFFVLELITGVISKSIGLVADSLDMLADSIVYGLALFAVGGTIAQKKNSAKAAGYLQMLLAIIGFGEAVRRFLGFEEVPAFETMIVVSLLALIGNGLCLYLLQKSKSSEVHMKASMIFTSNDVIVNIGVMLAGSLVYLTNSKYPDLIIGTIVFIIVGRGAYTIFSLSQ